MSIDTLDHHAAPQMNAEEYVVGAVLLSPDAMRWAIEQCSPADFAHPGLGALYGLVVAMRSDGTPVDAVTVGEEAARRRAAGDRRFPGMAEIARLFGAGFVVANAGHYGRIVREAAVGRDLQKAAIQLHQDVERGTDPGVVLTEGMKMLKRIRDEGPGDGADIPTLAEILAGDDEYDWLVPGLLERGDRFMLTAGEGGGKTVMLRQLIIMMTAGIHPFTCDPIKPVRSMVIDVENSERQWRRGASSVAARAAHFGQRDPRPEVRVLCSGRVDLTSERHLGAVHRHIDEHEPDVLMLGPLYKMVPRAITTDDDAAPLITALDSIRDRGVTLLMEAHAGHVRTGVGGGRDLRPRGSSAMLGWPEFGHGIMPDPDDPTVAHVIRWRGDRDQRDWPRKLRRDTTAWPWVDDDLDGRSTWMRHSDRNSR